MMRGLTGHFDPLSPRDAAYMYDDRPGHREMLVACYVFPAGPSSPTCRSEEALRAWMEARLGTAAFFTRTVRPAPLHLALPVWVPADEVDLSFHVRLHRVEGPWTDLRDTIARIAAEPIDLRRPPWELHAFTGPRFADGTGPVTVMVLKVHHCAIDGMGMRALEARLFSGEEAPAGDRTASPAHPAETSVRAAIGVPVDAIRFARKLRETFGQDTGRVAHAPDADAADDDRPAAPSRNRPVTRFNAALSGAPVFEVGEIPTAHVRTARGAVAGATVNDVLLSAVGGALRRLLDDAGELPERALAALVPISLRLPDAASGSQRGLDEASANQLVLGTVDLHTDIADPADRLAAVAASAAAEKARWMATEVRHARSRMDAAPAWLLALRGWAQHRSGPPGRTGLLRNTMVSNLPAPAGRPALDGAPLHAAFGVLPVMDGDRLRHLFSTTGDRILLCVNADRDVLGDPHAYVASIPREVDTLRRVARGTPDTVR